MLTLNSWQSSLSQAITQPKQLLELLDLDTELLEAAEAAAQLFPLKVPRGLIDRMEKGNPADPLLMQVLPLGAELHPVPGYSPDPLGEADANPVPGLLHKYHGRVLLTLTGTCLVNCRFCFRRAFPYADNNPGRAGWDQAIEYIANDTSIEEVILSGGDPLVANDVVLQSLTDKLNTVPHIKRIRIHSRIPILLPERITPDFLAWVTQLQQSLVLVVHCNHPNEISPAVTTAMRALQQAGVVLLNQSVLLKGVNDQADTLVALSKALFAAGIQPYYLHVLDKVQGTAHFDLPIATAKALHWEMSKRLSGYLVPRLVCEQPGAPAKLGLTALEFYTD